ncbi:MAG: hypothetical protein IKU57_04895, partial [Oscillospiraceae bacterium]|nr:hypothetical protein [Oscillospiraceae bacterium]
MSMAQVSNRSINALPFFLFPHYTTKTGDKAIKISRNNRSGKINFITESGRTLRGSDGSAAKCGYSDLSEWPRSADEEGALSPTKMPGTATGTAVSGL